MVVECNTLNSRRYLSLRTLGIGTLGGALAVAINSPIPWLLGSLCATAFAGLMGIKLVSISKPASRWLRVVIGVSLGSFVAESLEHLSPGHGIAIAVVLLFTLIVTAFGTWFFQRTLTFDRVDSFISSLPGGLSFLISLASDLGQRFPRIGLIHTVRVVVLVFAFSFLSIWAGANRPEQTIQLALQLDWHPQLLGLVLVTVIAGVLADRSGLSGGHVIFGLVVSALTFKLGLITQPVPALFVTFSMVALGVLLGLELVKDKNVSYLHLILASTGYTLSAMVLAGLIAWWVNEALGVGFLLYLLALAPGGIAEISLITLALGLDAGLVAMAHACRFFLILVIGPMGIKHLSSRPLE